MLEQYRKKRDFSKTTEPIGQGNGSKDLPMFVVQKHDASRLHYDLRLESGGVLKSWAVPKGPAMNFQEKRLAMMVEDHPLDYANFEGVIPEGNYGAGTVMVWDRGNYALVGVDAQTQQKAFDEGLKKGHLTFILNGQKLKGEFALIKLKRAKEPNAWLLIKAKDQFASQIKKYDENSVLSGKSMEEISNSSNYRISDLNPNLKQKMVHGLKPMLATLIDKPFSKPGWLYEIKWDGYRAIAEKENGKIIIYSRNGKELNKKFPEVVQELSLLHGDFVLDGELVVLDKNGLPNFSLIQNYAKKRLGALVYFVFDLLYLDGYNLLSLSLRQRRKMLETKVRNSTFVKLTETIREDGGAFFNQIKKFGLEGMIAKKEESVYEPGIRSKNWLKIKNYQEQEAVIVGFTEPEVGRKTLGSLLLAVYENGKLFYVGSVGTGFTDRSISLLRSLLLPLKQDFSSLSPAPGVPPVVWVRPELVCQIKFAEWTREGMVRQAVFLGLREDIDPKSVRKEITKKYEEV